MVHQYFDRTSCLIGDRRRHYREKAKPVDPQKRLETWFEAVVQKSAFMRTAKKETSLRLPAKLATALDLTSSHVTIVCDAESTRLLSSEHTEPLVELLPPEPPTPGWLFP